jgi:hypothetical protein
VSQGIGISIMAAAAATGRQWYNFGNESSTLDAGLGYQPSSSSIYLRWGSSDRIQGNGGSLFPVSDGGVTQGSVGLSFGGFYGAFLDAGRGAGTGGRTATVKGGTPTDGNGGAVAITGTAGGGTDRNGGGVSVTAGAATGSGTGGNITVQPGSSPSGAAGRIDLNDADGTQIVQVDSAGVDVSGDLDLSSASPQLTVGDGTGAGLVLVDADGSATQTFFDARHTGVRQWAWRVTSSGTFLLTNTAGENWFSVVQSGTVTLGGGLTVSGAAVTLDGPSLDFRVGSAASSSTFRAIKPDAGSWSRIFSVDGIAAANRRWVETFGSDESLTFNRWSGGAQVDTPLTLNASDGRVHVDTALQIGPTAVLYDSGGDFFIEAPTLGVFVESQGGTWEFDAGGDLIAPGGSTWTSTVVSSATGSAAFRASGASPTFLFGSGVGTPQIYLAKSDAGAANLWWMVDGTGDAQRRWLLQVDANEDWKLNRRDAAGASVDNPITVSWTSGEVFMESRLTLENINALNLSHASPVVTAGDATGTGGQFAYRKADASTFQWADVRSGGSSSTDRTWVVGFQGTSQDLRYDRYDGSTGALLDSPLRIDWGTGDIFAANDLYTSGLGAFGASAIPAGKSISLYVEGGAGRVTAASVSTDATNKTARFGVSHYTNAEEVVDAIIATCTSSTNSVSVGGSSIANAPTQFSVYTSANNTTVTGTERLRVDNNGLVQTLNGSDLSVDGDALTLHAAGSGSPNFFVNKVASGFATQTWRTAAGADTAGDKRFLFDTDESLKIQSFSGAWGTLVEFTAVDTISVAVSATFTSEAVFEQDAFFASILPSSPGTSNIGGASERFDVWADALDVNTLTLQSVSAPATPAANDTVIYSHDSDGRAKLKDSDGSIKILGLMPPIQFGPDDVARDFEGNIVADGTDPSAIYVSEWTTADRQALEFQNTASMGASWNKFLPETYSGKGLRIRLMLAGDTGSATTATFEAAFERVRTGDPADTSSFAATVSANVTMAAAADDFVECTISLSNAQIDGLSAGDFFRLHIRRPTGDTYAGDVRMWMGVIEEAV